MISRVLVAMEGSEMGEHTLRYALGAYPDAAVTVLTVIGEPAAMFGAATVIALADDPDRSARDHVQPILDRAGEIAAEYGAEIDTDVGSGHPAKAIVDRADGFDTVVIGSHRGSVADRLFVGNVAEKVFRRSPVAVTVVR